MGAVGLLVAVGEIVTVVSYGSGGPVAEVVAAVVLRGDVSFLMDEMTIVILLLLPASIPSGAFSV